MGSKLPYPTRTVPKNHPVPADVLKLAIVHSVCEMLAQIDFSVVDGAESELTLKDGEELVISVWRKGCRRVPVNRAVSAG